MSNRIGGDFSQEVMEAFRAAYAQQLESPDEDTIANNSGLPTDTVANTSPWIEHTGLWKYPSGKGPDDDLKQPFDPTGYFSNEVLDGDGEIEEMTDEEVENLVSEITGGAEEDDSSD